MTRMSSRDPNNYEWLYLLVAAGFGAVAKIAFDILSGKEPTIKTIFCQVTVALYSGQLAVWFSNSRGWDGDEKYMCVSIAGWLGAEMIKIFIDNVRGKK